MKTFYFQITRLVVEGKPSDVDTARCTEYPRRNPIDLAIAIDDYTALVGGVERLVGTKRIKHDAAPFMATSRQTH